MKLLILFFTIICLLEGFNSFPSMDYDDSLDKIAEEIFVSAQKSGNVKGFMDRIMDNLDVFLTLFRGNSSITTTGTPLTTIQTIITTITTPTSITSVKFFENREKTILESNPKSKLTTELSTKTFESDSSKNERKTFESDGSENEINVPKFNIAGVSSDVVAPPKIFQFENNDIVKAIKTLNGNDDLDTIPVTRSNYSMDDLIQVLFGHSSQLKPSTTTEQPTTEDILARLKDSLQNKFINLEYGERNIDASSTEVIDENTEQPMKFEEQVLQLLESDGVKKPVTPKCETTCYCFSLSVTTTTKTPPKCSNKITTEESKTVTVPCVPTTCPSLD